MNINLGSENGYDVASGIRGPDGASTSAARWKSLVTAVIRHFAGCRCDYKGTIRSPKEAIERYKVLSSQKKRSIRRWVCNNLHPVSHARYALEALVALVPKRKKSGVLKYHHWLVKENLL